MAVLYPIHTAAEEIGVIVEADTDVVNDAVKECLSNVAMRVAALSPQVMWLPQTFRKITKRA